MSDELDNITSIDKSFLLDTNDPLSKVFHRNFNNIKIFILILLIVSSFINKDYNFMKAHPIAFSIETVIYGLLSTLGIVYINGARGGNTSINTYIIWFVIICLFNISFQLSGFYSVLYPPEIEENLIEPPLKKISQIYKGINKSFYRTSGLFIILFVFFLMYIAYKNHNFNINKYEGNFSSLFSFETIIFGLTNVIPLLLVAYNREKTKSPVEFSSSMNRNMIKILILFITICILHVILQSSGFYELTFNF
jgi:hypothetical protein